MQVHGHIALGNPSTPQLRNDFFSRCSYDIGGQEWTLDYIEHVALRANSCKAFAKTPLLPASDSRLKLAMPSVDCRVHFALNCGAKSCPPIRLYEPDKLDEQLHLAARAFVEDESNLLLAPRLIKLSKIFFWYSPDFAADEAGMLRRLGDFLSKDKKALLEGIMSAEYKVEYFDYDWEENRV